MRRAGATLLLFLLFSGCAHPLLEKSEYGLPVVRSGAAYSSLVRDDPSKQLIDLRTTLPAARFDIRYATADNFLHHPLYPSADAWLRQSAAKALRGVSEELAGRGLALEIFDAYRPYRVTVEMWKPIRNPDYVADPAKGSRHNRGCAVDLTIVSASDGRELPMGTAFDDFTPRAAHGAEGLLPEETANRALLREVMHRHGFDALPSEWWHYDFRGWERYEVLDVPFDELRKQTRRNRGSATGKPDVMVNASWNSTFSSRSVRPR